VIINEGKNALRRSNDHDEIKNSSEYIHSLNITTICVGIKGADLDELQVSQTNSKNADTKHFKMR